MIDIDQFIEEAQKKGLEPQEVFQEAVKLKFADDSLIVENWKMLWAMCKFRGKIPNFILEHVQSLK